MTTLADLMNAYQGLAGGSSWGQLGGFSGMLGGRPGGTGAPMGGGAYSSGYGQSRQGLSSPAGRTQVVGQGLSAQGGRVGVVGQGDAPGPAVGGYGYPSGMGGSSYPVVNSPLGGIPYGYATYGVPQASAPPTDTFRPYQAPWQNQLNNRFGALLSDPGMWSGMQAAMARRNGQF